MTQPLQGYVQETNVVLTTGELGEIKKFQLWTKKNEVLKETLSALELSKINLEDNIKLFEHPIETGAVIVDHMILEPKECQIQAYINNDDEGTLRELEQLFITGTTMTMRADNKIVENVVIKSKPREISSSIIDKTLYSISFREAEEKEPVYVAMPPRKVTNKACASRVNSGVKQGTPKKKTQSWLYNALKGNK